MASRYRNYVPGGDENQPFTHTYVPVDPFKPSIAFSLRKLSAADDTNLLEDDRPPTRPYRAQGPMAGIPRSTNQGRGWYRPAVPEQPTAAKPAWRTIPNRPQQRTTPNRPQQGNAPSLTGYGGASTSRERSRSPAVSINRGRTPGDIDEVRRSSRSPRPRAESIESRIPPDSNSPTGAYRASLPSVHRSPERPIPDRRSISSRISREYRWRPEDDASKSPSQPPSDSLSSRRPSLPSRYAMDDASVSCHSRPNSPRPNSPSFPQRPPPEIDVSVYGPPSPKPRRHSGAFTDVPSRYSVRRRSRSPRLSIHLPAPTPHHTLPGDKPSQPPPTSSPSLASSMPLTSGSSSSLSPSISLRRYVKLQLSTSYVAAFLVDTLPRQIYLNLHLRLPYLYFSRVTRIFEEAEMSMPMIRQGILDAARANALAKGESGVFGQSAQARMLGGGGGGWGVELEPSMDNVGYTNLQTTWLAFVDALLKEWKTLNIISVLLLSAILTILQLEGAASDPLTRCTALLSMICALISLVYGCIYIIRFGTMKKTYKGAAWAQEAQRHKTGIWWNIWVMLALPATWLAWSVILYIATIMAFVWRTSPFQNPVPPTIMPSSTSAQLLVPRVLITAVLSMGIIYFILIALTLQRYGETMDRAWQERIWAWMQLASEKEVVVGAVDDAPNNAYSWATWKPGSQQSKEDVVEKEVKGWGKPESEKDLSRDDHKPKSVSPPPRRPDERRPEETHDAMSAYPNNHVWDPLGPPFSESVKSPSVKDERSEKNSLIDGMAPVVNSLPNSTSSLALPQPTIVDHFLSQSPRVSLIANSSDGIVSNENVPKFEKMVWAASEPQTEHSGHQMTCVVECGQDWKFSSPHYPSDSEAHNVIDRTIPHES